MNMSLVEGEWGWGAWFNYVVTLAGRRGNSLRVAIFCVSSGEQN